MHFVVEVQFFGYFLPMHTLSYLNKYLFRYKYYLIFGVLFIVIANVLNIASAWFVREAFNIISHNITLHDAFSGFSKDELYRPLASGLFLYGALILGMAFLRGFFLFLMRQTIIVMSRRIEYELKNEIYTHYQLLPLSFYGRKRTGDLLARISEDVSRVRMYLGPALMYTLNLLVLLLILLPVMFSVNLKLATYVLLPLPFLSISIYYINSLVIKKSERMQAQVSRLSTFTQEAFSGIRVIQSFAREKAFGAQFEKESSIYKQRSMSLVFVESLFFPFMLLLIGLSTILTIYVGAMEVMADRITVGNIAEFVLYVNMLTWPVTSLGWATSLVQRAAASQSRINELLCEKNPMQCGNKRGAKIKGEIEFRSLSFSYNEVPVLLDISFQLKAGESLAIVGKIGSGKTTLAQLLCRLYDPISGHILIDGVDLKQYDLLYMRKQIGYVPQDVFLFSDTIAANIAFGLEHVSEETLRDAARDAELLSTIEAFPNGFQTLVGERGVMLSGGQKQRVAIARALIRKPRLLIFDDCLSAVDTDTEHQILGSISEHMTDCTTLIVTHRTSSAKLANRVLVLKEGRVQALGTHTELMSKSLYYRNFYQTQLEEAS